jgi:hypothetical protein
MCYRYAALMRHGASKTAGGGPIRAVLTDEPLSQVDSDLLEHRALAATIARVIRGTPAKESIGIGLYGSWGYGKSTIGRLAKEAFAKEIKKNRLAWVNIEAWKFARATDHQPLRRHFLLQAYEAVGRGDRADALRAEFTEVRTTQQVSLTIPGPREAVRRFTGWLRSDRRRFSPSMAGLGLIVLAIILLGLSVWLGFGEVFAGVTASILIVSGVLSVVIPHLVKVAAGGLTVTSQSDRFRSVEEFDREFEVFLLEQAGFERFVFFIDDLDRCDDEFVANALATLQAFFSRPRCVFIVAADARQLKRAIRLAAQGPVREALAEMAIPPDETFLDKILQVAIHVPPLYNENLGVFAEKVSSDTRLGALNEDARRLILSYLVHGDVKSPRQVETIINDFLVTWDLAERRELLDDTYLSHTPLSEDLPFVAHMVVLRSHFPWFYELLTARPRLLLDWPIDGSWGDIDQEVVAAAKAAAGRDERYAVEGNEGDAGELDDEDASEGDGSDRSAVGGEERLLVALRGYLARTRRALAPDAFRIQEFIYLRSDELFGGLSGDAARRYRSAIANDDLEALRDTLEAHPDQRLAAAQLAVAQAQRGFGIERVTALRPLARICGSLSNDELAVVGADAATVLFPTPAPPDDE